MFLVGNDGTVKVCIGTGLPSNVAFVGMAGAGIVKNVGLGLLSNVESFVSIAVASFLHEVLLMTIVLSSSSSSRLL